MTNLLHAKCKPIDGGPSMSETEIKAHLNEVSGWHHAAGSIEKTFGFKDWLETLAFVNAMAWVCHTEDHHPEVALTYDRCVVRFNTHTVNGVSINDFICAAKVNALVAFAA
jgi:4a-hydroxytetrahydrobiopterin dehydratase